MLRLIVTHFDWQKGVVNSRLFWPHEPPLTTPHLCLKGSFLVDILPHCKWQVRGEMTRSMLTAIHLSNSELYQSWM